MPVNAFFAASAGLVIHVVYNRLEPRKLRYHFVLLVAFPVALVCISDPSPQFASILGSTLRAFTVFFATLLSSVTLYRISPFHPLAKYPGPIKHKISTLFMLSIAYRGHRHLYYKGLHERYGRFVRVGPNAVSIADADAIQPILGHNGVFRGEAHSMFTFHEDARTMFSTTDPHQHSQFRKTWNRGLNTTALKEYDPIFAKRTSQLIESLAKQQGVVDLGKWLSFFKFDFMGDLVFGGGFELMKAGEDTNGYRTIQNEGNILGSTLFHIPWIGRILRHMPLDKGTKGQREFSRKCAERRMKTGSMTRDLFYYFAEEDKPESQRPSVTRIINDAGTAIAGATETTSTTIAVLFYYALRESEVYKKLQAEVDAFFDRSEEVSDHQKLGQMPFLNACIEESLRMAPVSFIQRTIARGHGGITICGRFIPEGTHVLIPPYPLFRDSRYFSPSPEVFWPERWLYSNMKSASNVEKQDALGGEPFILNSSAFIPFSFGAANCIGKNLAYKDMRFVVASILHKFDLRFADGYDSDRFLEELHDRIAFLKGELPVVITLRQ